LLPWSEGAWTILVEDKKALLRYGSDQGLELESDSLLPIVGRLLKECTGDDAPKLRVWYDGDVAPDAAKLELTGCEVDVSPVPETGMAMMASTLAMNTGINLLQGEYSRQDAASLMTFKPWRAAIALLVLACFVWLGGVGYGHWQLIKEDKRLGQEIETLYRDAFPDAGKIIRGNERQQADRKLAELRQQYGRGSDTFLALLHISGEELHKEKDLQLEGLNYKGGILNLRLQGSDLSQFEVFKQKLLRGREREIKVEVLSAVSRREGVDGRIMIQERK
jgi:type II secretion system protein L